MKRSALGFSCCSLKVEIGSENGMGGSVVLEVIQRLDRKVVIT